MATRLNSYDRADLDQFVNDVSDSVALGLIEEPLSICDLIDGFELTRRGVGDNAPVTPSQMRATIKRVLCEYPQTKIRLRK